MRGLPWVAICSRRCGVGFASTTGILAALIPLAVPFLLGGEIGIYRKLLRWGMSIISIIPLTTWVVFVLPGQYIF